MTLQQWENVFQDVFDIGILCAVIFITMTLRSHTLSIKILFDRRRNGK